MLWQADLWHTFSTSFLHNIRVLYDMRKAEYGPQLSPAGENTAQKEAGRSVRLHSVIKDCLFLSLVVLLSVIPYIQGLGFYSDDWNFLGYLSVSKDQSLVGLFRSLYSQWVRMRPVQILYLAGLYWLFGPHPLGYHIVNAAIFLSSIVLFYLALRGMGQRRVLALAVPVIYALLPHYSTDRFWFAAFQANLSVALYFLSLVSDLRALEARLPGFWGWRLLSILSLLGSTLAYEITLPLFLLNLLLVWYRRRQLYGAVPSEQLGRTKLAVLLESNLLVLVSVIVFKMLTTVRLGNLGLKRHTVWFARLIMGAIRVSYGDYGLNLPYVIWKIFHDYPDWKVFAVGGVLGLIVFGYLYRTARRAKVELPNQARMLSFIIWGLVVFGLGYAIFLINTSAGNSATGLDNRVAIAAAVGVALSLVGGIGWVSTLLPSDQLRRCFFCMVVALLCTSGFLIINTIASFWIAAYRQEQEVLADIRQQFPTLPAGSTFILDGVCPYVGPAIVFESSWDLAGALLMIYRDYTLRADVVTPNLWVTENGLTKSLYWGAIVDHYPYEKLFVYHFGRKVTYQLPDAEAARLYFQTFNPDYSNGCPEGHEGHGVSIFNEGNPARSVTRGQDPPLVTRQIRYRMPEAGEVFFVWGINGWDVVPEEIRPSGTILKNGTMHTPMTHEGDTFVAEVQVPFGATVDNWFLIAKTRSGAAVEVWEADGDQAYRMLAKKDGVFKVNTILALAQDQAPATVTGVPLVTQEIRYHMPEAGEVYLLWGINGWAVVSQEIHPAGTVVKDLIMHTPMVPKGDDFVVKVQVPSGARLDYGFQIRKNRSGAAIKWAWDGNYRMIPSEDGVVEIRASMALVRAKNLLNALDFRQCLSVGIGIVLGLWLSIRLCSRAPWWTRKVS